MSVIPSAEVARYDLLARNMVTVYATGDAEAMRRINQHYGQSFTADDLRATVWRLIYYAGLTRITDRSLEILGRMTSLESIELYETKQVTDAGLAFLSGLPRLLEISLSGLPNVTLQGTAVFPAHVRVDYNV